MKNIQTQFLKIVVAIGLFFSIPNLANAQQEKLQKADSLFKTKQYTQSLEIYQSVFNERKYSPAMLLKMAYINEGLGKVGATLYALKLYYQITQDEHAEKKMEELASKFKLSGYSSASSANFNYWLNQKMIFVQAALLVSISGFLMAIFFFVKNQRKPWSMVALLVVFMGLLVYVNNFNSTSSVIVARDQTYLMEGPSAGANVSAVIGEGNLLQTIGHEDVWLKVRWLDKIVYVKESAVLKIEI